MPLNGSAVPTVTGGRGIFQRIVATGAAAGIVAGLLLTGVQHLQVTQIIRTAETYEVAAAAMPVTPAAAHGHAHGEEQTPGHEHEHQDGQAHEHGGWQPEPGLERTFYTAVADISMAVGYALLLAAILTVRDKPVDWRRGLLWGACGYVVVFVAPSLGLPPELPGTMAAPVMLRQAWWLGTALATAISLALLVWARHPAFKLAACVLLCVPHVLGAPQPALHGSVAPEALARSFVVASAIANAVFWLALGALTAAFYKRFNN